MLFSISPIVYNEYTKFIKRKKERGREREMWDHSGISGSMENTAAKTKHKRKKYPARPLRHNVTFLSLDNFPAPLTIKI